MTVEVALTVEVVIGQGADYGRILVGLQVPATDRRALREFLDGLGYPYVDETDNPVYGLFLR